MKNYLRRVEKIKKKLITLKNENFKPALNGAHHKVFVSNNYIIRFRDDNHRLLQRETKFLKKLNHPLIPKILWSGEIDQSFFMIENRLPGKTINLVWKNISIGNKKNIIKQIVKFLQYQKTQTKKYIYSVNTGKKYKRFFDYLADDVRRKIANIKKIKQTNKILKDLLLIIEKPEIKNLFSDKDKIVLVHGDLINHNLLTDGENLTGVLDWELALFGDSDYDLFRLFYYQECAKAYQEQGIDETFEADYMNKLVAAILKSNFIKNKKIFRKKYRFARAVFFVNALYWAVNSNEPEKNINELMTQWDKKKRG